MADTEPNQNQEADVLPPKPHAVIAEIGAATLAEMLRLPMGSVVQFLGVKNGSLLVRIAHDGLPEVGPEGELPEATVRIITREVAGTTFGATVIEHKTGVLQGRSFVHPPFPEPDGTQAPRIQIARQLPSGPRPLPRKGYRS